MARFDIIPVIDLKGGRAMRAAGGNRAQYRPLATPLCPDGDPLTAAAGLLDVCPSRMLYIADLDAIEGRAPQHAIVRHLANAFSDVALWVDDGFAGRVDAREWPLLGTARLVLGSESLAAGVTRIAPQTVRSPDFVLSLDFRGDRFLGPPELLAEPSLWPDAIIVMCLHSVGATGGPDFARLSRIIQAAGNRRVYAAGGVRHIADIEALAAIGAAGVLVSSALHNGGISRADIRRFAATRTQQGAA